MNHHLALLPHNAVYCRRLRGGGGPFSKNILCYLKLNFNKIKTYFMMFTFQPRRVAYMSHFTVFNCSLQFQLCLPASQHLAPIFSIPYCCRWSLTLVTCSVLTVGSQVVNSLYQHIGLLGADNAPNGRFRDF